MWSNMETIQQISIFIVKRHWRWNIIEKFHKLMYIAGRVFWQVSFNVDACNSLAVYSGIEGIDPGYRVLASCQFLTLMMNQVWISEHFHYFTISLFHCFLHISGSFGNFVEQLHEFHFSILEQLFFRSRKLFWQCFAMWFGAGTVTLLNVT